ncbi:MAG TPA: class I SAM-dependent methyltransferase [Solirubrobacteraceae bacterium]
MDKLIPWTGVDGALTACVWCAAAPGADDRKLHGRTVCAACGVASTDPWPSDESLAAAYGGAYRPAGGRFAGPGDALLALTRGTLARRLDQIAPPGRVLDVGAGTGGLVAAIRRRGRDAVGLEREADGEAIRDATLGEVDGQWAAIVFWHSLEHLPEPRADLDRAIDLLAPGGVMTIAIPNADSLQARLFGDRWLALDLPRHLTHIPASALTDRLRERGLEVERVSHWRAGQVFFGWLDGLVGLTPGAPSLYDAVRRPAARFAGQDNRRRAVTLASAVLLAPLAALGAAVEVRARRGGTVYVEARRP